MNCAGARDALGAELGRPATDTEIAERLGIDKLTLWRWEADLENSVRVPLERSGNDDSEAPYTDWDPSLHDDAPTIEDVLTESRMSQNRSRAISRLRTVMAPMREQTSAPVASVAVHPRKAARMSGGASLSPAGGRER